MTDASFTDAPVVAREEPEPVTLPPPVLFDMPVMIGDCATPFAGSTVLHALLERRSEDQ